MIRNSEETLRSNIRALCGEISRRLPETPGSSRCSWGPAMQMSDWCGYLAFDNITDLVFGFNFGLLGDQTFRYLARCIHDAATRNAVSLSCPLLRLGRLDKFLFPQSVTATRAFWNWAQSAMDQSLSVGSDGNAFERLHNVSQLEPEGQISQGAVKSEIGLLIVAGEYPVHFHHCSLVFQRHF